MHLLELFELRMGALLNEHVQLTAQALLDSVLLLQGLVCCFKYLRARKSISSTPASKEPMSG